LQENPFLCAVRRFFISISQSMIDLIENIFGDIVPKKVTRL